LAKFPYKDPETRKTMNQNGKNETKKEQYFLSRGKRNQFSDKRNKVLAFFYDLDNSNHSNQF